MTTSKAKTENKLLSRRVNFPSMQDAIEQYLPDFVEHFRLNEKQADEMKCALQNIFASFLSSANYAATLGAEKGIAEAFEMMKDEAYFETVKNRRKAERERSKAQSANWKADEEERRRRREEPTLDERKSDVLQALREMIYFKDHYKKEKGKVVEFRQQYGDEELGAIIKSKLPAAEIWASSFDVDKFIASLTFEKVSDGSEDDEDDFFNKNDWLQ